MKIINTAQERPKKKTESPKKRGGIPPITKEELDDVNKWMDEHKDHGGFKTSAWFGLQWMSCPSYVNVTCGCDATYIRERYTDKPVRSSGALQKLGTKNSGGRN